MNTKKICFQGLKGEIRNGPRRFARNDGCFETLLNKSKGDRVWENKEESPFKRKARAIKV